MHFVLTWGGSNESVSSGFLLSRTGKAKALPRSHPSRSLYKYALWITGFSAD